MQIQDLLKTKQVDASGFPAIAGLSEHSEGAEKVILSSLAPSILQAQGVTEYYALELPRGTVFQTSKEIIEANLPVRKYGISEPEDVDSLETVIVSRHTGTVQKLKEKYPSASVLDSIQPEQIEGKHVVGTLPPHLIVHAGAYTAVTIRNFDYSKDGDLTGKELDDRLIISDRPLRVRELTN